jgi:hypothetical protein
MFVLEILFGLKPMQGNVTCAFLHTNLEEDKKVYINMPMGFTQYGKNGKKKSLKLKKTLYCTGFVKVQERSGNKSQSNLKHVGWSNQNLIPAYSLDPMSFVWLTSTTLFFSQQRYH